MDFNFEGRHIEVPSPALARDFTDARRTRDDLLEAMEKIFAGVKLNFNDGQTYYFKAEMPLDSFHVITATMQKLEAAAPVTLTPVFNDPHRLDHIVAYARTAEDSGRNDALIRMKFAEHTDDLPAHVHPRSGRVLIIESGVGYGYYATPEGSPSVEDIKRVPVKAGDIITFPENTLHTFEATDEPIVTITYHTPYIDFDEEESFTKGDVQGGWYPSMYKVPAP